MIKKFKEYVISTTMLAIVLCNLQCQGSQQAAVEKINGTSRILLPLYMEGLAGLRDGETMDIKVKFMANSEAGGNHVLPGPDSLILRIQLRIGVPTTFQSGSFRWYQKDELFEGPLTSLTVSYNGGQGALPSMDGRFKFRLSEPGHYETYIPSTEIVRP